MARFVVFGAGAIGGVVGARLSQAGHDVVLIARGPHLDAIQRHGLRLQAPGEDELLRIPAVSDPGELDWQGGEVVLLAVKSQDTDAALQALRSAVGPRVALAVLQNGIDNERRALRLFARVYGVCVMCPASHLEPGVVQANSAPVSGMLDIGCYPWGTDDLARACADAFNGSTFDSRVVPDVMRWKRTKLLINLANAVEALCPRSEDATRLVALARSEGERCLRAAGLPVATAEEDRARRGDRLKLEQTGRAARSGGSSWQSLRRSAGSVEADYLNGEIALLGRLHGVATPVNSLLQEEAQRAARGGLPPGQIPARLLLDRLG